MCLLSDNRLLVLSHGHSCCLALWYDRYTNPVVSHAQEEFSHPWRALKADALLPLQNFPPILIINRTQCFLRRTSRFHVISTTPYILWRVLLKKLVSFEGPDNSDIDQSAQADLQALVAGYDRRIGTLQATRAITRRITVSHPSGQRQ